VPADFIDFIGFPLEEGLFPDVLATMEPSFLSEQAAEVNTFPAHSNPHRKEE
jgi:hypothetical protein